MRHSISIANDSGRNSRLLWNVSSNAKPQAQAKAKVSDCNRFDRDAFDLPIARILADGRPAKIQPSGYRFNEFGSVLITIPPIIGVMVAIRSLIKSVHGTAGTSAVAGVILGGLTGYFSAHYFPLWGGFLLLGEPGSRARELLVPGHMLLFAILLGLLGFGLGFSHDKKRPKR